MPERQKVIFLLLILLMAWLLRSLLLAADDQQLAFLLKPVAYLVALATDSPVIHYPGQGYHLPVPDVLLDKTCAGINFLFLCFALLAITGLKYTKRMGSAVIVLLISLPVSYLFAVVVNAIRIRIALVAQYAGDLWLGERPHHKIHEAAGIMVNLFFLIIILVGVEYILKKQRHHEVTKTPGLDTGV